MRESGTSSTQTAGCGHTEIQPGVTVTQDYRLQRLAGETQQGYWLQKIAGSRVLPVSECCRLQSLFRSLFRKIPLTNRLQSLLPGCRLTQPSVTGASQELEILVK